MFDTKQLFGATLLRHVKRPVWLAAKALTGKRLQSSVHFTDVGFFGGMFEASSDEVVKRLPARFDVAEHRTGRTWLDIVAVEYRASDILAPYGEVFVRVPGRYTPHRGEAVDGYWVLQMPVTTEEARWCGVDNYGFPKIVADIEIERRGDLHLCRLSHRATNVLELRVEEIPTESVHDRSYYFSARTDGMVVRCHTDVDGQLGQAEDVGGATLQLGYHAIADQLRAMGVASTGRALYCPRNETRLSIGTVVGPLEARPARPPEVTTAHAA
jgi:hypothetical protein